MRQTMSLDALPKGCDAEIVSVDWTALAPAEGKRLRALGFDEGTTISIAHRGIFLGRDPLALKLGRTTIAVRRTHARAVTVTAA